MADLSDWVCNVAALLTANGLGALNLSMWIGQFPKTDQEGLLLVPTGGFASIKVPSTERPTLQITARAREHCKAMEKALVVHSLLNEPASSRVKNETRILYSKALQPPFQITRRDSENFFTIVCNYQFWLT